MSLGAGIGLAALIIAGIGMWMPIIGLFIGWLALVVACFAALCGDKGFSIATVVLSAFAFWIFTPSLWIEAGASADVTMLCSEASRRAGCRIFSIALLIAPIVSMILFSTGRLALRRPKATSEGSR